MAIAPYRRRYRGETMGGETMTSSGSDLGALVAAAVSRGFVRRLLAEERFSPDTIAG